jgi:hypothetical protein
MNPPLKPFLLAGAFTLVLSFPGLRRKPRAGV